MSQQALCRRGWEGYLKCSRDLKMNLDLDALALSAFQELYSSKEAEFRKDDDLRETVSALLAEHSDEKAFDQLWLHFSPQVNGGEGDTHAEVAFQADYRDPDENLSYIKQTLDEYCRKWNQISWYSPYCSIVQSSGYGKSKTVLELAKRGVFVIYCSLMDPNAGGYPPRSAHVDKFGLDRCSEEGYQRYVVACLRLIAHKEMTSEDWLKYHYWDQGTTFLKDLEKEYNKVYKECPTVSEARKELVKVHNEGEGLQFLFVFDEARKLLEHDSRSVSSFYHLRKTFRLFSEGSGVFCVLMDTASIITNFMPPKSQDPSSKGVKDEGLKLFDPIYVLAVTDVFSKENDEAQTWDDLNSPEVYLKYGRPLWGSRLLEGKDVEHVIRLAGVKLLGDARPESEVATLSVLGPLVCLDVCPGTYLNSRLVSNHMRICVHVSERRDVICSSTGMEPILAEAALILLQSGDTVHHLSKLHACLRAGWVEGGFRGELVARICLILAVLHKTKKLDRSWSVQDFLKSYSGNPEVCSSASGCAEDLTTKRLLEGKVFFTGFTSVWFTPTQNDLLTFFRRCSGLVCKSGQKGVDLIIPVLLRDTDEGKYLLKPENMSALLVQVKNRITDNKGVGPNDIGLGSSRVQLSEGTPYVSLLLELSLEKRPDRSKVLVQVERPNTRRKNESGNPQHHLELDGLPAFVSDEEGAVLRKILVTRQDPGTYKNDPLHEEQLQKMWPLFKLEDDGNNSIASIEGAEDTEDDGELPASKELKKRKTTTVG